MEKQTGRRGERSGRRTIPTVWLHASRSSKLVEHSPTATSGGSIKDSLSHSIFVTPCELHFACSPSPALQAEGCAVRARAAEDTSPESSLPSVHIPLNEVVVVRYNGKSTTCRYVISVNTYNITIQVVGFIDTKTGLLHAPYVVATVTKGLQLYGKEVSDAGMLNKVST